MQQRPCGVQPVLCRGKPDVREHKVHPTHTPSCFLLWRHFLCQVPVSTLMPLHVTRRDIPSFHNTPVFHPRPFGGPSGYKGVGNADVVHTWLRALNLGSSGELARQVFYIFTFASVWHQFVTGKGSAWCGPELKKDLLWGGKGRKEEACVSIGTLDKTEVIGIMYD